MLHKQYRFYPLPSKNSAGDHRYQPVKDCVFCGGVAASVAISIKNTTFRVKPIELCLMVDHSALLWWKICAAGLQITLK